MCLPNKSTGVRVLRTWIIKFKASDPRLPGLIAVLSGVIEVTHVPEDEAGAEVSAVIRREAGDSNSNEGAIHMARRRGRKARK